MPKELVTHVVSYTHEVEMPPTDLLETDEQPLETPIHRATINLLIEQVEIHNAGRRDYYVGGNMFIYFSSEQAKNRDYKGPDFFYVQGVDHDRPRQFWATWDENGRYPDVIIELLSPSTADADLSTKKDLYERTFRTSEYFCYDPLTYEQRGWRLEAGGYVPLLPDSDGRLVSDVLGLRLGTWEGRYLELPARWLRFFDATGRVVPLRSELEREGAEAEAKRAEAEAKRAEAEAKRADAAEAELSRVRQELDRLRSAPPAR